MRVHARQREAIVAHRQVRGRVEPVFECAAFANETIEVRGPIVRNSIPQRVIVCARDDGDRVDLHVAELFERPLRGVDPATERLRARQALRIERDAPQ